MDADSPSPWRRRQKTVAAVVLVAVVAATTSCTAADDSAQSLDSSRESCFVEDASASGDFTAPRSMSLQRSAQPVLQWTPVDPPAELRGWGASEAAGSTVGPQVVSDFIPAEDGRVAVVVEEDETFRLEVTSDGIEWTAFPLPATIHPQEVHISDDRWVVVGQVLESGDSQSEPFRFDKVLLTEDSGATWSEVRIDPGTPPFFDVYYLGTAALHVSENRIVLVSHVNFVPRFAELLVDRGLIDSTDGVENAGLGDRTVSMWMPPDDSDDGYSLVKFSYDELRLSEEQAAATDLWFAAARRGGFGHVRTYAGHAGGLSATGDFISDSVSSAANQDGFMLSVGADDRDGWRLLAAADGRKWTEVLVEPPVRARLAGAHHDGALWAVISVDGPSTVIATLGCGQAPRPLAAFESPTFGRPHDVLLTVGTSGLAAVASFERPLVPTLVGWSTDGTDWDWQSAPDAFGFESRTLGLEIFESRTLGLEIAVGDGFVLASAYGSDIENQGWFVAMTDRN